MAPDEDAGRMSEPTETLVRAIALLHDLVDPQRNGGNVPPRSEISEARIVAFIRAERQAVWEEAAKMADQVGTLTKPTDSGVVFDTAWIISAHAVRDYLRERAAAEGQEPTP